MLWGLRDVNEIWKPVVGYEGLYEVSSYGNVRSLDRVVTKRNGVNHTVVGRVLSERISNKGYRIASIRDAHKQPKTYSVHRLVMEAFCGKRPVGKEINHIDGNRLNNRLENLEYVTHTENMKHAFENNLMNVTARSKKVLIYNETGTKIAEYYSAREAGRELGIDGSYIAKSCRNGTKIRNLEFKYEQRG